MKTIFGKVLLLVIAHQASLIHGDSGWTYTAQNSNPSHWAGIFNTCGGFRQSPINIESAHAKFESNLAAVNLSLKSGVNLKSMTYTINNNGHSVEIVFPKETWFVSLVGGTENQYEVVQLHFHWGATDSVGTEHFLNGKQYSLEAHLVCFDRVTYSDLDTAKTSPYGLAVLGFLSEVQSGASSSDTLFGQLGSTTATLPSVVATSATQTIPAFNLRDILNVVNPSKYYRYDGSLTTPPCTQNVLWTVFEKIIPATEVQLQALRNLDFPSTETAKKMANNFRPTQPLNSKSSLIPRVVYRSWNGSASLRIHFWIIPLTFVFYIFQSCF